MENGVPTDVEWIPRPIRPGDLPVREMGEKMGNSAARVRLTAVRLYTGVSRYGVATFATLA